MSFGNPRYNHNKQSTETFNAYLMGYDIYHIFGQMYGGWSHKNPRFYDDVNTYLSIRTA